MCMVGSLSKCLAFSFLVAGWDPSHWMLGVSFGPLGGWLPWDPSRHPSVAICKYFYWPGVDRVGSVSASRDVMGRSVGWGVLDVGCRSEAATVGGMEFWRHFGRKVLLAKKQDQVGVGIISVGRFASTTIVRRLAWGGDTTRDGAAVWNAVQSVCTLPTGFVLDNKMCYKIRYLPTATLPLTRNASEERLGAFWQRHIGIGEAPSCERRRPG